MDICEVYWGSHGCSLDKNHEGHCICDCCDGCDCAGKFPFYGPDTRFYGDDAEAKYSGGLDIP